MNIIIVRACSVVLVPHAYLEVILCVSLCYYYNNFLSVVSTDITVVTRMAFKPTYGQMLEFELSAELFSVYVERVNLLFTANEKPIVSSYYIV